MALLRHVVVLLLFGILSTFFRIFPPRAARFIGAGLGDLIRLLLTSARIRVEEQLKASFPSWSEKKIKTCVKWNFRHYGMTLSELFHFKRLSTEVKFEDEEKVKGQKMIVVTGHCGNWELMARVLAQRGGGLCVVAKEVYLNTLNTFLVKLRKEGGVSTILRGTDKSPRDLLRAIKGGENLGIVIDQDTKVEGIFVDFFGRPAHTPIGAAKLSIKYGIPAVTIFIHREAGGTHVVTANEPIDPAGYSERRLTKLLTMQIEEQVRRHPTQWVWVHRRWKKRPPKSEKETES